MGAAARWVAIAASALIWTSLQAQTGASAQRADTAGSPKITVNIEAQPIRAALQAFGRQTGVQVLFRSESVSIDGLNTPRVSGELSAQEALERLLANTGLKYEFVNKRTVRISSARPLSGVRATDESPTTMADPPASNRTSDQKTLTEAESPKLQEVVVTAQKREERLADVPVPVTAISGESLAENNQVRIQDYALTVPGLSVSGQNGFYQTLSIRGITTGTANPTVGIMIDDVPFGSSSIDGGGLFVPDIDPGDLERVEVLRGPQGTLYGASSMGGLLKFVTIDPSVTDFSGRFSVGTSSVYNGECLGYNVRGSVNVPLSDTWALRLSAFSREDPGYIDDPELHRDAVNTSVAQGGRVSALWRPADGFSLKLSALYQDVKIGGDNNVEVASGGEAAAGVSVGQSLGNLDQSEVPNAGASEMKVQVYSATGTASLGGAVLTAISGYNVNSSQYSQDYSALIDSQPSFAVSGTRLALDMRNDKFTQELRLAVPFGTTVDWLLGGFYSHEHTAYGQNLYAEDSTTGGIAGEWVFFSVPQTYTEYSGYTDLTFHVNDRFDVQLGGRESEIRQTSSETQIGVPYAALIGSPNPDIYPPVDSHVNAFTYLLTPRFKLSPEWMAYARLASGYRPGGPNVSPGVPSQYQPDKTQNYEIGLKGGAWDRKVYLDGSIYYIDWKNIQLTLLDPENYQGYTANASRAKSQGLELSVTVTPVAGLTTAAWVAWNTATLKQGFPYSGMLYEAYGVAGDRLPFGSRFSGNLSVTDEFRLSDRVTASVGVIESYVGNQVGGFQDATAGVAPPRQFYPPYARTDLRAGVKYDTWSLNLFANNVTNRLAIVPLGGLDASPLPANFYSVLQPRVMGVNLIKVF